MKAIIVDDELIAVNALKRRVDWNKYQIDKVFTAGSMNKAIDSLCFSFTGSLLFLFSFFIRTMLFSNVESP